MDIGVLINNVGLSYPYPELFLDLPNHDKIYDNIIQVNVSTTLAMCQIVMPTMVENRRGVIINVSSTAGHIPSPMLTVYGASKVTSYQLLYNINEKSFSSFKRIQRTSFLP